MGASRKQIHVRYTRVAKLVLDAVAEGVSGKPEDAAEAGGSPGTPPLLEEGPSFGTSQYAEEDLRRVPMVARAASLGCGCPTREARLRPGERVLDIGAGGGIDVILAALQVGVRGVVVGLDMTSEMNNLGEWNVAAAGIENAFFIEAAAEDLPLRAGAFNVVLSNCTINLIVRKDLALGEIHRVLAGGGRFVAADIVAEDQLSPAERLARGTETGSTVGVLSRQEYLALLTDIGFDHVSVTYTHCVAEGIHGAIVLGTKPKGTMPDGIALKGRQSNLVEERGDEDV